MSVSEPAVKEARIINTVSEAIDSLSDDKLMEDLRPDQSAKRGDPDFGLWFRGHAKTDYQLVPSLLRESIGQQKRYIDEVSLTRHFRAMNPEAVASDASDFEWLVTMQHYLAPTRLLDWTENLLVSLYFAVRDSSLDDVDDAAIWILNARRLNSYASASTRGREVAYAEDPDVIARSCLCRSRDRQEWHDIYERERKRIRSDRVETRQKDIADAIDTVRLLGRSVNDLGDRDLDLKSYTGTQKTMTSPMNVLTRGSIHKADGVYARLLMPVAVYANRSNRRIRSQSGVFTLHGGKYVPFPEEYRPLEIDDEAIGMPIDLEDIDASLPEKRILKWLRIPKKQRASIRQTLSRIGVTDATLFPELDYQAKYLLSRWTYQEEKGG
jgi:hypothetical protein